MTQASGISCKSVAALLRTISDAHTAGGSPNHWKRVLLEGLVDTAGVDAGVYLEFAIEGDDAATIVPTLLLDHGYAESQRPFLRKYLETRGDGDPIVGPLFERMRGNGGYVVARREDVIEDDEWYASTIYKQHLRDWKVDLAMLAMLRLRNPDWLIGLGLHHRHGSPALAESRRDLIEAFFRHADWLFHERMPNGYTLGQKLPPRLRRVVFRQLNGESAGEIAYNLALSAHTVRGYIKQIYRVFNVSSQTELMALHAAHLRRGQANHG